MRCEIGHLADVALGTLWHPQIVNGAAGNVARRSMEEAT
jgi:hypothetical protein